MKNREKQVETGHWAETICLGFLRFWGFVACMCYTMTIVLLSVDNELTFSFFISIKTFCMPACTF